MSTYSSSIGAEFFQRRQSGNYLPFMEDETLLGVLCYHEHTTAPYPEPHDSNQTLPYPISQTSILISSPTHFTAYVNFGFI
jgi:hypothetical protein